MSQVTQFLNTAGLLLDICGAVVLSAGLFISREQAIDLSVSRWSGDDEETNLRLPAVRDRLKQARNARVGVTLLFAGFVLQIVATWLR